MTNGTEHEDGVTNESTSPQRNEPADADSAASAGSESPEEGQAARDAAEDAVDGHDDV